MTKYTHTSGFDMDPLYLVRSVNVCTSHTWPVMATECLCINMMETRNVVGSCDVTVHLLHAINQYVYIELLIGNQ